MFAEKLLRKIAGRREDAIGLDIGSGSVKMADVVLRNGKPYLKRMALMESPERAVEEGAIAEEDLLADTLQKLAAKNGFAGGRVAAALGGRNLFIREVNFPRMTEKEMREAIRWDLEKYVPFSPDNLYFDFWIVGSGATEMEVRVLLVAVPKEVVDSLVRVVKKAGLKLIAIDIEPLAIQRTLPAVADCMVIDSGAAVSQVTLFQKHSPVFTRNIPIGGNQFTETMMEGLEIGREEAELVKHRGANLLEPVESSSEAADIVQSQIDRVVAELAGEVRRTLEYYQVQNRNVSISSVFITGGGAKMAQLPEKLSAILELPVVLHDPLLNMEIAPSFNRQYLRGVGPQMAVAVGLALRGCEE